METKDAIIKRRSVRNFSNVKVSYDLIKEIIEVTRYYPSWKNTQIARFHIVENSGIKEAIATQATFEKSNNCKVITECPTLLVLTIKKGYSGTDLKGNYITSKGAEWEMFDAGIAAQTFSLVAFDKGVSSVILGLFHEEVVASLCNLPKDEQVAALIPIGYPSEPIIREGVRKPLEEVLFFI